MTSIIERRPVLSPEHPATATAGDSVALALGDQMVESGSLQSVTSAARMQLQLCTQYERPGNLYSYSYSTRPAAAAGLMAIGVGARQQPASGALPSEQLAIAAARQPQPPQPLIVSAPAVPSFLVVPHTHAVARVPSQSQSSGSTESPLTGPPLPARQPPAVISSAHSMQPTAGALISSAGLLSTTQIQQLPLS